MRRRIDGEERRPVQRADDPVPTVVGDRDDEATERAIDCGRRDPGREERVALGRIAFERSGDRVVHLERATRRRRPCQVDDVTPPVPLVVDGDEAGTGPLELVGVDPTAPLVDDRRRQSRVGLPRPAVPVGRGLVHLPDRHARHGDLGRTRTVEGRDTEVLVEAELPVALGVQVGPFAVAGDRPAVQVGGSVGRTALEDHGAAGRGELGDPRADRHGERQVRFAALLHLGKENDDVPIDAHRRVERPEPVLVLLRPIGEEHRLRVGPAAAVQHGEAVPVLDHRDVVDDRDDVGPEADGSILERPEHATIRHREGTLVVGPDDPAGLGVEQRVEIGRRPAGQADRPCDERPGSAGDLRAGP